MNIQSSSIASTLRFHDDVIDKSRSLNSASQNGEPELQSSTASMLSNSQTHYKQDDYFNSGAKNPLENPANLSSDTTTTPVLSTNNLTTQSLPLEGESSESHEHCEDPVESLHDETKADSRGNSGNPGFKLITEDGITYTATETEWVQIEADGVTLNMTTDSESEVPVNFGLARGENNTINGTRDRDLIGLIGSHNEGFGDCGDDLMSISGGTLNVLHGGHGEDTMDIYSGNFNTLFGGDNDDILTSHSGTNLLSAGSGNDILKIYNEQPTMPASNIKEWGSARGDSGDDEIFIYDSNGSVVYGDGSQGELNSDGNDTISVFNSTDTVLHGGGGNDVFNIDSSSTFASADGGSGTDTVKIDKPLNPTAFTVESVTHRNQTFQKISGSGEPDDFILVKDVERIEYNDGALILDNGAWIVE